MRTKRIKSYLFNTAYPVRAALLLAALGSTSVYGEDVGDKLSINDEQSQAIMEKTAAMEARIQQRQQQQQQQQQQHQESAIPTQDSTEYEAGFSDGYNKAILDLVKARLLNDSSLLPKPKPSVLRRAAYSNPESVNSQNSMTACSPERGQLRIERPMRPPAGEPISGPPLHIIRAENLQAGVISETGQSASNVQAGAAPAATNYPARAEALHKNKAFTGDSTGTAPTATVNTTSTTASSVPSATTQAATTHSATSQSAMTQSANTMAATAAPVIVTTPVVTAVSASSLQDVDSGTANVSAGNSTSTPPVVTTDLSDTKVTAQNWLQKSNTYLKGKDWPQAINAATESLALDAGLVDSYIARSWAYAENGQIQKAFDDIAAAIHLAPGNALAYNNQAYVYELSNNRGKAQESYQKACDLHYAPACDTVNKIKQVIAQEKKTKIDDLTNRSYQQFQQKDWKGVIKITTELMEEDPENTVALVNRAGAYTELGLYNKALDDCNHALIIDPKMAIAYNNKGYVLELMKKPKKAAMEYETACVLGVQQSCEDFKRLSHKVASQ